MSPKFRRGSKNGIFGNYVSMGGDQVRPPDLCFAITASIFIIGPSGYVLVWTNFMLFGTIGGILVGLVYLASILNLCRLIYKCAYTEPGVIPAVPSARSDLLRAHS